jgi:cytochrome b561
VAEDEKSESLETEVEQILEEARMVLPGIQALFGFQLIAVFSERFDQALGDPGKRLHVTAVVLIAVPIGLTMAPAAYHRQAERDRVSRYFANYASFLIALAMAPLSIHSRWRSR